LRTGAPVWVGRRRVAVARALCAAEPAVDVIVSDDGLQHRALARQAQVIVFDERGVGNGLLLPAGPLREPLPSRVPAASVVLYNAARPSTPLPGWTAQRRLAGAVSLAGWWRGEPASLAALHALRGREVLAAAGLAAPERFFTMLETQGLRIRRLPLPDHHRFTAPPWPADSGDVLVTEKDAVKLRPDAAGAAASGPRVWVVALDFDLPPDFIAAVLSLLGPPPAP
jgi:tetraacyldisaccharide 4'-kinase